MARQKLSNLPFRIRSNYTNSLDWLLRWIYIAAKHYLVTAIDIYREERINERTVRSSLGETYFLLGNLLFIRSEILVQRETSMDDESRSNEFLEFLKLVSNLSQEHNPDQSVKDFIEDIDVLDVRRQATEAFREALKQFQREIEEYLNRYRIPQQVYFSHGNVINRRLHFEIWYVFSDPRCHLYYLHSFLNQEYISAKVFFRILSWLSTLAIPEKIIKKTNFSLI